MFSPTPPAYNTLQWSKVHILFIVVAPKSKFGPIRPNVMTAWNLGSHLSYNTTGKTSQEGQSDFCRAQWAHYLLSLSEVALSVSLLPALIMVRSWRNKLNYFFLVHWLRRKSRVPGPAIKTGLIPGTRNGYPGPGYPDTRSKTLTEIKHWNYIWGTIYEWKTDCIRSIKRKLYKKRQHDNLRRTKGRNEGRQWRNWGNTDRSIICLFISKVVGY